MIEYAKQIAYSTTETVDFSYEMAKKYEDSEGCFVECGVAAGAQIIAMRAGAPNKLIHAFDSFQGIPYPSNKDDQYPGLKKLSQEEQNALPDPGKQELKTTGVTCISVEDFKQHLINSGAGLDNLEIHEGWFEETLPNNEIGPIAILRLDGDLYNSTMVCLEYLFPKVISGGVVIVDDWQLLGCRYAVHDYFKGLQGVPFNVEYISNIAYFIK